MKKILAAKSVLVVEDDDALRQILVDELNQAGFEASGVNDGEKAVARILKKEPQLLLVDIVLPRMDGITLLRYLRTAGHTMPAIVLSNLSTVAPHAEDLHVEDYLVKAKWKLRDVVRRVKLVFNPPRKRKRIRKKAA